jgi:kumamolisin
MPNTKDTAAIPKNYVRLDGSERHPSPGAKLIGPADASQRFDVTIVLRQRPDGEAPPDFDHFKTSGARPKMSAEEFAQKYGASAGDIKKVTDFARGSGLAVKETHPGRRTVVVSGTMKQMSKAFGVTLSKYEHQVARRRGEAPVKETYRGRDGYINIPKDLKGIIVGVFGLDNRNITKRNSADPPNTAQLTTRQITHLYKFPTNSAAGQIIGIVSVGGGYIASDISATFAGSPPTITDVSVGGQTNLGKAGVVNDFGETTQDICIAGMAAPGAAIAVYFQDNSQRGWVDMLGKVAHPAGTDPQVSVVSSSFPISDGDDRATLKNESVSHAFVNAVNRAFQDAAIQGVTICIATGDTGSNSRVGGNPGDWGYGFPADHKAHVQFPGSSPWVLAVGGTTIGNVSGSTFDEYVWNDPFPPGTSQFSATGGGVSDFFALPSYQNAAGVPVSINDGHIGRGVPDVAANASPNSGYKGLIKNGKSFFGGGTSASSPLWAGLIAVINAALGENVGFVNPAIYAIGSSGFRDIVPGAGPVDNSNSGVAGYPAGPGWDACTGWGSPNGQALLKALKVLKETYVEA